MTMFVAKSFFLVLPSPPFNTLFNTDAPAVRRLMRRYT